MIEKIILKKFEVVDTDDWEFEVVDTDDWEYILKQFDEIKDQRDNLVIKNIHLERENARLIGKIKKLEKEIKKLDGENDTLKCSMELLLDEIGDDFIEDKKNLNKLIKNKKGE